LTEFQLKLQSSL